MAEIDDLRARMTALEERIAHQDGELAQQREQLDEQRRGRPSMRRSHHCPACGGGRLIHVAKPTEMTNKGLAPQAVRHTAHFWGTRLYGPIEHFICRNCRLIESYVIDLEGLEPDGKDVHAIEPAAEPEPDVGPYR